ncbi:MAG TPA: hypothetical protein VK937_13780 [Candidatus Limnocylindria bacterium]|nr:hypothetical protein [Candidatus Limnocylindria bacterium]
MKVTTVLGWLKDRPGYSLAILLVAASGYAIDRWFLSGLMASKWIGLPQYASAMRKLQNESRNWGIVVLVLEIAALALVLPRWPKGELALTKNSVLTLSTERNVWTEYLGRCILHTGLCILGTLGLAFLVKDTLGHEWSGIVSWPDPKQRNTNLLGGLIKFTGVGDVSPFSVKFCDEQAK